jgi:hypothetical protein
MKKISKIISAMLVFAMLFQAPCALQVLKPKASTQVLHIPTHQDLMIKI